MTNKKFNIISFKKKVPTQGDKEGQGCIYTFQNSKGSFAQASLNRCKVKLLYYIALLQRQAYLKVKYSVLFCYCDQYFFFQHLAWSVALVMYIYSYDSYWCFVFL